MEIVKLLIFTGDNMAVNRTKRNQAYGPAGRPLGFLAPEPIQAQRAPTSADLAEPGTLWVDLSTDTIYAAASSGVWTTSAASGVGIFTSLQVTPGNASVDVGDLDVLLGNFSVGGNAQITGDLNVDGNATFNGDLDITSASALSFTTTSNTNPALSFTTNGGVLETMVFTNTQGTAADAIQITASAGGIQLLAVGQDLQLQTTTNDISLFSGTGDVFIGTDLNAHDVNIGNATTTTAVNIDSGTGDINLTSTDAINLSAVGTVDVASSTGAFSVDGVLASNVTVTGAGADLLLNSVGGSVLVSSTEDAALAIRLHANGGVSETIQIHSDQGTGVASVGLLSDVGGITVRATGLASADAINLEAVAGGIDMDSALQTNITSSQAAVADAIRILASAADGGIDIDAGTGGITIDSTGAISVDAAAASNFTVTGAFDLTLSSSAGSVVISGGEAANDAIQLTAAAGGVAISSSGNVSMAPATASVASPTASSTTNARVGRVIFTGFTTASAASQTFTITNSTVAATSGVFVTVAHVRNVNANIRLTLEDVEVAAAGGSFLVKVTNNGADALDGNVIITWWVLS